METNMILKGDMNLSMVENELDMNVRGRHLVRYTYLCFCFLHVYLNSQVQKSEIRTWYMFREHIII